MFGLLRVVPLFDYLEKVAFFGDHSESASAIPFDVDCAETVYGRHFALIAVLQFCVRV
jgi:hypothetical protein